MCIYKKKIKCKLYCTVFRVNILLNICQDNIIMATYINACKNDVPVLK